MPAYRIHVAIPRVKRHLQKSLHSVNVHYRHWRALLNALYIAGISFMAPVSLFTCITDTNATSLTMLCASMFTSYAPVLSTRASFITYCPFMLIAASYTDGCSVAPTIIRPPPRRALSAPNMAVLLLSVPPEVYIISSLWHVWHRQPCPGGIYVPFHLHRRRICSRGVEKVRLHILCSGVRSYVQRARCCAVV